MQLLINVDSLKIEIECDEFTDSPREWDNVGKMICFHNKYDLGDETPKCSPNDYWLQLMQEREYEVFGEYVSDEIDFENVEKYINKHFYVLPLYLFDHGDLSISTSSFSCPWDSGQVGFIYAPRECSEQGNVIKCLESEVEVFNKYLQGEVFRFTIKDQSDNILDSCGGFYDLEDCKRQAISEVQKISKTICVCSGI